DGLNAGGHRYMNAGVGAPLGFFGKARAFIANEERDGLAPVDLPGGQQWLATFFGRSHAGRQCADAGDFELCQENREGHSREDGKMKGGASGGAERLRRVRAGRAADAGGGSGGTSRSERGGRSQDRSDIAGILHASEDNKKRSARGTGGVHEVVERGLARL